MLLCLIWQRLIPSRISFFLWQMLDRFLATNDALCSRGICMVSRCICGQAAETACHLFLACQWIKLVCDHFCQILGMRPVVFLTPHALLLHWRRYALSLSHFRVLLPCFILWQIWKAHNSFRFDSQSFSVIVIIHRVGLDLGLAIFAFGYKTSQLRGVLDSRIVKGLQIIVPPKRPIRLVSWIQPPLGVIKLTVDGCSRGNPGIAASDGILRCHRGEVLAPFGSFLGQQQYFMLSLWLFIRDQISQFSLDTSCQKQSLTPPQWFLGFIPRVLFGGTMLSHCIKCVLGHLLSLLW